MRYSLFLTVILLTICGQRSFSQSIAINTDGSTANASALLDVKSTAKGMLIPRMSRTERNAIASPATGLLIFQSSPDSVGFYYYNGSAWTWILSNSNDNILAWRTGGNAGTLDASHFIGTTDNIPFNIRVNNQRSGRIDHIGWNSFYGYQAGNANTSGIHNTAMGYQALQSNLSGTNNTAIGTLASNSNTTGDQNTATGYGSMYDNTVGINNTAYGFYALYQNKAGSNATAIGVQSMLYANNSTTPFINNNVALGYESLKGNAPASGNTGLNNTALGYQTMWNNSSGSNNTTAGLNTLYQNTTAGRNTAIGSNALYSQSFSNGGTPWSSENIAIGDSAMYANQPTTTTNGYQNTAVGNRSLRTNATGYQNTATGTFSMFSNTIGQLNTGTGWASLYNNVDGYYNTAVGAMAMYYNTAGGYNVGVGTVALHHNLTGIGNTAVGQQAGLGTTGNSFSYNTLIGYQTGYNLTTGSNNVFIGSQAGFNVTSGSNKLYIANSNVDPALIYGDFATGRVGIGTNSPAQKLSVNGIIESLSGGIKFPDATIQTTAAIGIPAGSITMYAGTVAPAGYLVCDGAAVNRVTYANLFTALGVAWGNGDGSTTFNLPDLRGRFPRGVDGGSGNDPDAALRTASNAGGNTGNNVGSLQTDTLVSHSHVVGAYTSSGGTHIALITAGTNNTQSTLRTEVEGGNETRPKNVYVYYIIKY